MQRHHIQRAKRTTLRGVCVVVVLALGTTLAGCTLPANKHTVEKHVQGIYNTGPVACEDTGDNTFRCRVKDGGPLVWVYQTIDVDCNDEEHHVIFCDPKSNGWWNK